MSAGFRRCVACGIECDADGQEACMDEREHSASPLRERTMQRARSIPVTRRPWGARRGRLRVVSCHRAHDEPRDDADARIDASCGPQSGSWRQWRQHLDVLCGVRERRLLMRIARGVSAARRNTHRGDARHWRNTERGSCGHAAGASLFEAVTRLASLQSSRVRSCESGFSSRQPPTARRRLPHRIRRPRHRG